MAMTRAIAVHVGFVVAMVGATAARAQQPCLRWSSIPPSNYPDDMILSFAVFDDGAGPMLYAGGYLTDHVGRWDGAHWSALSGGGLGSGVNDSVHALIGYHDPGTGDVLVAGGDFSFTTPGGGNAFGLAKWNGVSWSEFGSPAWGTHGWVSSLAVDGNSLYVGGEFDSVNATSATNIAKWNGSAWSALGSGVGIPNSSEGVLALAMFDDGHGDALYAAGGFSTAGGVSARSIAKWDGVTWTPVGVPPLDGVNGGISALAVFDAGHGPALYAAGQFTEAGGIRANQIAKWDGVCWSSLGHGIHGGVLALADFDDGSGPGLYAGGFLNSAGDVPVGNVAKWDGSTWSALGAGVGSSGAQVRALCPYDSSPRGHALYAGGLFNIAGAQPARDFGAWSGCTRPVSAFCFGDGTVAACPCSNQGASGHGCENSNVTGGAQLSSSGSTNPDTIVLRSTGELPTPLSIVLQGDDLISAAAAFGDGLRCAGGNLRRLYIKNAVSGQVNAPSGSEPSITARSSALGDPISPGTTRYYQVYYRDPSSSFCAVPPGGTFNATNGIRIVW